MTQNLTRSKILTQLITFFYFAYRSLDPESLCLRVSGTTQATYATTAMDDEAASLVPLGVHWFMS